MMQKLGLILLAFVALVAIGGLMIQLQNSATGQYTRAGCGSWYCGPQRAQLAPDEACMYAGYEPIYPVNVYQNQFGTMLSACRQGSELVGVPLVQTIYVP